MIVTSPVDELRSWTRAQAVAVSKGWWVLLLTGLVSILAGGIIIFTSWSVDDLVVFVDHFGLESEERRQALRFMVVVEFRVRLGAGADRLFVGSFFRFCGGRHLITFAM